MDMQKKPKLEEGVPEWIHPYFRRKPSNGFFHRLFLDFIYLTNGILGYYFYMLVMVIPVAYLMFTLHMENVKYINIEDARKTMTEFCALPNQMEFYKAKELEKRGIECENVSFFYWSVT